MNRSFTLLLVPLILLLSLATSVALCQTSPEPAAGKDESTLPPKKVVKAKKLPKEATLTVTGRLTPKDALDPVRTGCVHHVHLHRMKPGKSYLIEMKFVGSHFDSF